MNDSLAFVNVLSRSDEVFVKFNMGMCYNPLLKSWSWSNDQSVNYALYAQKLQTVAGKAPTNVDAN